MEMMNTYDEELQCRSYKKNFLLDSWSKALG